jgi:WD40 repeat protein
MVSYFHNVALKPTFFINTPGENLFISWSPNGKYFAVVNCRNELIIYDIATCKDFARVSFGLTEINEFVFTPDSDHILISTSGQRSFAMGCIELLSLQDNKIHFVDQVCGHTNYTENIRVDPTFSRLAFAGLERSDRHITLWDTNDLICYNSICTE